MIIQLFVNNLTTIAFPSKLLNPALYNIQDLQP